nr:MULTISPECIES: DUF3311 domain-containing protein [Caballeronia]
MRSRSRRGAHSHRQNIRGGRAPASSYQRRFTRRIALESDNDAPRGPWLWVALFIPYVALLWLPFYNDTRPSFAGFPFFYWYQFLWVPLTSLLLYIVHRGLK